MTANTQHLNSGAPAPWRRAGRHQDPAHVYGAGGAVLYGDLVNGTELERDATGTASLKPREDYRYVGRSVEPAHLSAKVMGEAVFVHDLRPKGMAHVRVVRPPTYTAALTALDPAPIEAMPRMLAVVRDGSFLGVIAEREEQMIAAAEALAVAAEWPAPAEPLPDKGTLYDWHRDQPANTTMAFETAAGPGEVAQTLRATYLRPYQMRASIGPSAAVALLEDGRLTVDTHSQSVFWTAEADLDAEGNVLGWRVGVRSTPHNTSPMRKARYLLPARYLAEAIPVPVPESIPGPAFGSERNAVVLYDFPGHRVLNHFVTAMLLRVLALRGLAPTPTSSRRNPLSTRWRVPPAPIRSPSASHTCPMTAPAM